MTRTTILSALISALVLAIAAPPAQAQGRGQDFQVKRLEFDLDHFKCYRNVVVNPTPLVGVTVDLKDQFDAALGIVERVEVFVQLRFCNPVAKRFANDITDIGNDDHHLTLYNFIPLEGKPITGFVLVANQFGRQKLEIESANILAVPTHKLTGEHGPPDGLDHYKCYFAQGTGPERLRVVGLSDQFETTTHKLLEPVLFCNPAQKTDAAGRVFTIGNREDHLTCYKISIGSEPQMVVLTFDQFSVSAGVERLIRSADILCVPSKKVDFKLDPDFGLTAPGR